MPNRSIRSDRHRARPGTRNARSATGAVAGSPRIQVEREQRDADGANGTRPSSRYLPEMRSVAASPPHSDAEHTQEQRDDVLVGAGRRGIDRSTESSTAPKNQNQEIPARQEHRARLRTMPMIWRVGVSGCDGSHAGVTGAQPRNTQAHHEPMSAPRHRGRNVERTARQRTSMPPRWYPKDGEERSHLDQRVALDSSSDETSAADAVLTGPGIRVHALKNSEPTDRQRVHREPDARSSMIRSRRPDQTHHLGLLVAAASCPAVAENMKNGAMNTAEHRLIIEAGATPKGSPALR